MPWIPSDAMLRRDRRLLNADERDYKVLVEFARPVLEPFTAEFYRIGLQRHQLEGSEETFYRAEVFQPSRVGIQPCPCCREPLSPISAQASYCHNPACVLPSGEPTRGKLFVTGPLRGVIRVETPKALVAEKKRVQHGRVWQTQVFCAGVKLVLDRRYPDHAKLAVKRAAGLICDQYGWGMR